MLIPMSYFTNKYLLKNELLDKQKKGKKRMRQFGKVDIPQNAFLNALKMNDK